MSETTELVSQGQGTPRPRVEYHHGRTPAAWTGMTIAMVGSIVATVGFLMPFNWPIIWVGLGLLVGSALVGGIMRKMGYGQE